MTISIAFQSALKDTKGALVLGISENNALSKPAKAWDTKLKGVITKAIENSKFKGKTGETLMITSPSDLGFSRILAVGLGKAKTENDLNKIGGAIYAALAGTPDKEGSVEFDMKPEDLAQVAAAAHLRSWTFDKYHTGKKLEEKSAFVKLTFVAHETDAAKTAFKIHEHMAQGIFLTRGVVAEPPNVIYPETLAAEAKTLEKDGVKVEILGVKEMTKLGMGALLGVGQGSIRESKLVVMTWIGAKNKSEKPLAFVGKGVTFDTGGISIKPANGMEDMKWDMAGAGTVIGLMKALALRKAKVNVVGVVGLVENMPSGSAQRPGDVVTTMSGQTIEVLNTDAEGRLVLADALWYTQDRFDPQFIVDLATLTGAIIVSLGQERAGLFSNNDKLAKQIEAAADVTDELVWRMPVDDVYDKEINCDVADMKNTGGSRGGGSITAAMLLKRFVNNKPWAHLDIAGVAWTTKDIPVAAKGATAFGVRMLDRMVRDNYEGK